MKVLISPEDLLVLWMYYGISSSDMEDITFYGELRIKTVQLIIACLKYAPGKYFLALELTSLLGNCSEFKKRIISKVQDILHDMVDNSKYIREDLDYYISLDRNKLDQYTDLIKADAATRAAIVEWAKRLVVTVLLPFHNRKKKQTGIAPEDNMPPYFKKLRSQVLSRDGTRCTVTGNSDYVEMLQRHQDLVVSLRLFPVIPTDTYRKPGLIQALSKLTDGAIRSKDLRCEELLKASNWVLLSPYVLPHFVSQDCGISATKDPTAGYVYNFVNIRPVTFDFQAPAVLAFGGPKPEPVADALPRPEFCNISLAVAKITYFSGASAVLDRLIEDEEDILSRHSYLDGRPEVWTILCNKLAAYEATSADLFP
ncbi:uncharacterized protein V1510DRAFT_421486 [Dipodascopsis tothii]|uniref:uncharacterized protein n=1 Tax=Dipodascopsis tothii TaxID=44089 RepID=UPI0034CFF20E